MRRVEYLAALEVIERFDEVCTSVSTVVRTGVDPAKRSALLLKADSILSASRVELAGAGAWTRDIDDHLERAQVALSNAEWGALADALKRGRDTWAARRSSLPTQVAFFPYQAAMWDSLESVWRAAAADSSCEAFVVPIPYVKRDPKGNVLEECYEGAKFPDGVPVEPWQGFIGENALIDIAYIHNPYDGSNYVTQVHPEFFSAALKERAALLVYVPYYVLAESRMTWEAQYRAPGVFAADIVALQSEVAAQTARDVIEREYRAVVDASTISRLRSVTATRVQALGSPKLDSLHDAMGRRDDYKETLPPEWRDLIVNPDGTSRPILLYDTTIGPLLDDTEAMLAKIRKVLASFSEVDDAVLWWRPHPLISATLRSMRPAFADDYDRIVEDFKSSGMGILDETPDLLRALVLADAYYGNEASLGALVQSTGRPILIQALHSLQSARSMPNVLAAQARGEYVWCAPRGFNALMRLHRVTGEVGVAGAFPGESELGTDLFGAACLVEERVLFAPMHGRQILAYHPEADDWNTLEVPRSERAVLHGMGLFRAADTWGDKAVLVGAGYPGVVVVDPAAGKATVFDRWVTELEELVRNGREPFAYSASVEGDYVSFASARAPAFVRVHLRTGEHEIIHIPECATGFAASSQVGGIAWLAEKGRRAVVRVDVAAGEYRVFDQFPEAASTQLTGFTAIEALDDGALVFDNGAATVYRVSSEGAVLVQDSFEESNVAETSLEIDTRREFRFVGRDGKNVVALVGPAGQWVEIAPDGDASRVDVHLNEADQERVRAARRQIRAWHESSETTGVPLAFYETSTDDLQDFLTYEVRGKEAARAVELCQARRRQARQLNERMDGSAGKTIHRAALRKLAEKHRGN